MKILFFSPRFYPDIGGVERHVLEVSYELLQKGHTVDVITEASRTQKNDSREIYQLTFDSDKGVKVSKRPDIAVKTEPAVVVYRLSFGKSDFFKKFRIWMKILLLRSRVDAYDIIHCHDVFFWYLPLRFLLPQKKVFITFHGWEGKFPVSKKVKMIRKISENLTNGNICVGKYIQKWYGTRIGFITYGGARVSKNSKLKSQSHNVKLKIIFIGRLDIDTGSLQYLAALKHLKEQKINFDFTAIGDGSLRNEFEKFGKVTGFINDVTRYLEGADIVFASSYLSILESLALKKLIISVYDNPLKKDYLEMTPFKDFIVITNKSSEIVLKVKKFQADPVCFRDMIEKGSGWARKQTWEEVTNKYLKLWKVV